MVSCKHVRCQTLNPTLNPRNVKEGLIRKYLQLLFVPVVMILFAVLLVTSRSWGHDGAILACSNTESVVNLGERINENGTLSEGYDSNADGKLDIEAISHVQAVKQEDGSVEYTHSPYPLLYVVDLDYDGQPDRVYVDKNGKGQCEDIVEYEDLTQPHAKREDGQL